jgi:hypothetical protein
MTTGPEKKMAQFRTEGSLREDRRFVIPQRESSRHAKLSAPSEQFYCLADTEKTNERTNAIKRPASAKLLRVKESQGHEHRQDDIGMRLRWRNENWQGKPK